MNNATFDFDEEIDRREVPALKSHLIVLGADGENLFPAGVADMDFKAPPTVLRAMATRLEHGIFGYEAVPDGLMPALTSWLENRHGWQVDQTWILRAPNVLNSLALAARLFTDDDDGIIVQPPVFFDFYDIITENKRQILKNPLILRDGQYAMDYEGLEKLAAHPRARMLYLCNPHNPVGRVWRQDELQELSEICIRNGVLIVSDEIHGDITFPGHSYIPFASLSEANADNCITCISPAKSFNIAACCHAFTIISNETYRKRFQAENSRLTVNKNNAFASAAMEAAYRDGGPWLDAVIDYVGENLKLVRRRLAGIPGVTFVEPEGTFLVWFDFRGLQMSPNDLTAFLRGKAGWGVTRGPAFGEEGRGFARVNIACTRQRLAAAIDQLEAAIKSLRVAV